VHQSDPPTSLSLSLLGQTTTTTPLHRTMSLDTCCHPRARASRSTVALRRHIAAAQGQRWSTSMHRQGSSQEKNKSSESLRGVATRAAEISGVLAWTTGAMRPGKRADIRDLRLRHLSPRSCVLCLSVAPPPLPRRGRSEGQSESQQGGGARRRTADRDSTGALRPEAERMAGGGGRYLPAGQCTAGVTLPPISGQAGAEASLEIDPTARRSAD
jgi:hypothetical protein